MSNRCWRETVDALQHLFMWKLRDARLHGCYCTQVATASFTLPSLSSRCLTLSPTRMSRPQQQ